MAQVTQRAVNFRNFVFGVEDSLVSTVGLLSGIASADVPRKTIFITGVILILVEAISMAAGSFLSEYSSEDLEAHHEVSPRKSVIGSITMLFSYLIAGLIPLLPYAFIPTHQALIYSIVLSVFFLFILGIFSAKISKTSVFKGIIRMIAIAGVAIVAGILAGNFLLGVEI